MSTSVTGIKGGAGSDVKRSTAGEANTQPAERGTLHISTGKFIALASEAIGANVGRDDDEHPLPPGPWDPVIRASLEQTYLLEVSGPWPQPWRISGPQPDPWFLDTTGFTAGSHSKILLLATILARHPEIADAIAGGHNPGQKIALNPQPLPPRVHFMVSVAQTVVGRGELLQELATATANLGERQGIIIVGGYVSKFCEEWCGSEFRLRWPFPWPRPKWFTQELSAIDLVVLATQFEKSAKEAFGSDLRQNLAAAAAKLAEAGLARVQ